MALDLAYLVLERCPLRGRLFRALLIVALDADADDFARISVVKLARWGRFSKRHAQEMYEQLQREGWLLRVPIPGDSMARRLVIRRRLLMLPPVPQLGGPRQLAETRFAGRSTKSIDDAITARARQTAEDLREFHGIRAGAHLTHKSQ